MHKGTVHELKPKKCTFLSNLWKLEQMSNLWEIATCSGKKEDNELKGNLAYDAMVHHWLVTYER